MKPTDILRTEHQVIEQVLNCLEKMSERTLAEKKLDAVSARQVVDFLRTFADRCHHGKEEVHLFPMMESKGVPRQGGPTGVMLMEHDQGRFHIGEMDKAIDAAATGDGVAVKRFVEHAHAYLHLLRDHIYKENNILFNMADQLMSETDQKQLMEQFTHVEHEEMGTGTHEKYLGIARELAEKYGVADVASATANSHAGHCCHH